MEQRIEAITTAEEAWVEEQLAESREFVSSQLSMPLDALPSVEFLDEAFSRWLTEDEPDVSRVNAVINCVGVAFGQHLLNVAHLDWVIAIDTHGTELAVYGLPGKGDVLVYPQNFVAKRYESRQVPFMASAVESMLRDIEQLKDHSTTQSERPWWKFWS